MAVSVAIVCEDRPDRDMIVTLAERLIRGAATWIESEAIGDYVEWRGFRRTDGYLRWTELDRHADDLQLVVRFRDVPPLHPYSQNALRAIRVLARSPDRVDAIIMVPDSDTDKDRLKGLEQARDYAREALPIIVGLAHTKRECWHICGFEPEPESPAEAQALAELASEFGCDIRTRTEELTAKHAPTTDKRSAKRVLTKLCGGNHERELRCLSALPLPELKKRGANNGLAHFLEQIQTHLVPLFAPTPPSPG
jgi:hypothetical protein